MQATLSRTDLPAVFELHNADLSGSSVRGSTPIARDPTSGRLGFAVARADAPLAGHEHLQGAFDGYDLDTCIRRSREGHLAAAMGLPLPLNACDDFARGYLNFNPDDGERLDAGAEEVRQTVLRQMHANGELPERRKVIQSDAHRVCMQRWEFGMWLVAALMTGLAAQNMLAALRALGAGA